MFQSNRFNTTNILQHTRQ